MSNIQTLKQGRKISYSHKLFEDAKLLQPNNQNMDTWSGIAH